MTLMPIGALDQCSDEMLMTQLYELSSHADEYAAELAAVEAAIQARMFATYGKPEKGSPRVRISS
ncbi:hypothetical protein [Lysobacter fragariae]